jgi:GH24 family phage-related lysozyme (muramidase)
MSAPPDNLTQHLEAELDLEEGNTAFLYDDAVGPTPFKAGMTLKGNLTAGEGINLMTGFDAVELAFLDSHRIAKARAALSAYAWYNDQDEVRQVALADLTYNLGIAGLLHWPKFLYAMSVKDYPAAVGEITSNAVWIAQVHPARANRIAQEIKTGAWPTDITVPA